ncbi:hypothetical protein [Phytomonospora endophytica]|uniref:Pectate lyase superfamily protein domain-containing protein n=1 Tax=Phytomonospora endophytica TaxID=714109 RepID=A0A841G2S1_9ACTN|nr:hypothetical protein [Phytomonospora endophytica]MBB6038430.1 hypothetical protein [Phytomonospora endophytica]GIG64359.1 hypothetical protein Pen01_06540 [Phytomonospora endophytica]
MPTADSGRDGRLSRRSLALGALGAAGAATTATVVASTPAVAAETLAGETWEVVTEGFNDAAVAAAMARVLATRSGNAVRAKLILPPGNYALTKPLLAHDANFPTNSLEGLSIQGMGIRSTTINWNDTGTAPFITASRPRLRFLHMSGFTAASTNAANEFAYLVSDTSGGYNQGWLIQDVEFNGSWLRVFGLDGGATANLNSEFVLERVFTTTNSVFADAFFRCGGVRLGDHNQQNQFLNYWIKDCCLTLSKGTVFTFPRGGSIRVQNGSWSAANATDGPITWFHMPAANSNNHAAMQLTVRDVKFEPKAANHKIIDCAWSGGSVLFDNCNDHGSIQNTASKGYNLHRYVGANPWGFGGCMPSVRYQQCQLTGFHQYEGAAVKRGGVVYDGSYFYRGDNGNMANATTGTDAALRWTSGAPRYRFRECYNVVDETNWA